MEKILLIGSLGHIGKAISLELADSYEIIGFDSNDKSGQDIRSFLEGKGKIDHLIYSVSAPIQFKEAIKEKDTDFDLHFSSQVKVFADIVSLLIPSGSLKSILVIGSNCLFNQPPSRMASYTAAKYALLGLIKSYAQEFAAKGVRVNMISPGLTGEGASKSFPSKLIELTAMQTPMKRLVHGKDVAKLSRFLLGDDASYLTGLNIPLDGGLHMN